MSVVYIISEYGKLSASGENFLFRDRNGTESKIMLEDTKLLVMNSHVSLTGECLHLLAKKQMPVYLIQSGSSSNISLDFGGGKNGFLRQKQYQILSDGKKSLEIAKAIVAGKIRNEIAFLERLKRNGSQVEKSNQKIGKPIEDSVKKIKSYLKKSQKCRNKEQLRGTEGAAAKEYFGLFGFNILPEWAEFKKRSMRPPETNVNATLSFLYSILTCRVQNALEACRLDTMCSNLHEMTYGKNSLAFDMVEEFRTPVCETLCCSLFNHGVLKPEDFESRDEGVFMTKSGSEKVVRAFEVKMESEIKSPETGENLTYEKLIFEQAILYKRFVAEGEPYVPFLMK